MSDKIKAPLIRFRGFTQDWEQRKLGELLEYEQPTKYIVKSIDYDDSYETPVLTAGQSFILGYTNEEDSIKEASNENPVIIFDDFTTGSHYVNFPFKVKSSAMKLLSLKSCDEDFYFVFIVLKNIKYIPQSHERHWISKFSEFNVSVPSFDEQTQIGTFFHHLDNLITLHQRKIDLLEQTKQTFLQKMFPKDKEDKPQIRFDGFTDAWEQRKLKDMTDYKNGKGHEDRQSNSGKYELVNLNSISIDGGLKHSGKFVDDATDTLLENDLVMILSDVGHGDLLGRVALIPENSRFVLNQRVALLRPNDTVNPQFLFSYINANQQYFKSQGAGMSQLNISKGCVENFTSYVPDLKEQEQIGKLFLYLDNLITLHQRKLNSLKSIKQTLLKQMFI